MRVITRGGVSPRADQSKESKGRRFQMPLDTHEFLDDRLKVATFLGMPEGWPHETLQPASTVGTYELVPWYQQHPMAHGQHSNYEGMVAHDDDIFGQFR